MNLQTMAPSAKRSLAVTLVFGAIAAGIYFLAVEPTESKLKATRLRLTELTQKHANMTRNLKGSSQITNRLAQANGQLDVFRKSMLAPVLESYAMGAKALVGEFATGAGLYEVEYEALPPLLLQLPKRKPGLLHARLPVKLTAHGSYQAAVSFIRRVEKELPLAILQSLEISSDRDPDSQRVEIVFEWPVRGKTPESKKGAVKK